MTDSPVDYELHFNDFDEVEWEMKEYCPVVTVSANSRVYEFTFFTPLRLSQEISQTFEREPYFTEKNIVVIPTLDRAHIEAAVRRLAERGFSKLL